MKHLAATVLSIGLISVPVFAADIPAAPEPENVKNCKFVTNDCEVCVVEASGKVVCSSVGTACLPTRKWCLVPDSQG